MITVVLRWTDLHRDGGFTSNEATVPMATVPHIGETVSLIGITTRKVERVVHKIDHRWDVEITVSLESGYTITPRP